MANKIDKSPLLPLEKAIKFAGSQYKLADLLGVTQPTICYWLKKRKGVPTRMDHCLKIEEVTNGFVKAKTLNPKLFS